MNFAVIGSGGREHSICFKLKQSPKIKRLICIPGNAGTREIAENINININNFDEILAVIKKFEIDIVIVGPEEPLVNGIVDFLKNEGIRVLGPDKFSAQLEGSKAFMKNLCKENNIPTARFGIFEDFKSACDFLSKSKKIGTYITKRKGLMMTGFWFPYVWEKRNSQYHIKGELYEVDDEDFKKANQIELNAGYKLKEIDKGIFGYIYPKRVDIKSTMVNTNAKKKYYEWRHEED